MEYNSEGGKIKYVYPKRETSGEIELWFRSTLSLYKRLEWTEHMDERLAERGFTREDITEFFEAKRLKVVWRPDYKTISGDSARITGELEGFGLISVIVGNFLTDQQELTIYTAYQISHSRDDTQIYLEGQDLFADWIDKYETDKNLTPPPIGEPW
jgi:hypothetical protein